MKNLNEQLGCQVTRNEDRHAGLENGHLNLLTFDDVEMLRWMLKTIGFPVDDTGIVNDKEGVPVKCSGCGCKLTLDEIGYVMPPSYFYCCDPICIYDYFERYGYPDHTHTIQLKHPDYIKEHLEDLMMVSGDADSMLKLFCNECNKIVGNPIWDDQTHGPYCPDCKTTLIEKSPDEEAGLK